MNEIMHRLEPIFRDVFDDPNLKIVGESNAESIPGWDSLAHINLVSAVESEFKIRFALSELQDLKNVGDMVSLMHGKLARAGAR